MKRSVWTSQYGVYDGFKESPSQKLLFSIKSISILNIFFKKNISTRLSKRIQVNYKWFKLQKHCLILTKNQRNKSEWKWAHSIRKIPFKTV